HDRDAKDKETLPHDCDAPAKPYIISGATQSARITAEATQASAGIQSPQVPERRARPCDRERVRHLPAARALQKEAEDESIPADSAPRCVLLSDAEAFASQPASRRAKVSNPGSSAELSRCSLLPKVSPYSIVLFRCSAQGSAQTPAANLHRSCHLRLKTVHAAADVEQPISL